MHSLTQEKEATSLGASRSLDSIAILDFFFKLFCKDENSAASLRRVHWNNQIYNLHFLNARFGAVPYFKYFLHSRARGEKLIRP